LDSLLLPQQQQQQQQLPLLQWPANAWASAAAFAAGCFDATTASC